TDAEPKEFADAADIPEWAVDEIALASAYGIILGDTDNNCNPNANIKREDMFLIAYRALDLMGMIPDEIEERDITLTDADDLSAYAAEQVTALINLGYVDGNADGTLNPLGTATRAEGAQFLFNILTK
ncbi:MAG: S-layer homology domain-containing protein, partial [Firmicutes bacterium]|nr:S-layer homology domain-containing protein [Bacillota bacterium]